MASTANHTHSNAFMDVTAIRDETFSDGGQHLDPRDLTLHLLPDFHAGLPMSRCRLHYSLACNGVHDAADKLAEKGGGTGERQGQQQSGPAEQTITQPVNRPYWQVSHYLGGRFQDRMEASVPGPGALGTQGADGLPLEVSQSVGGGCLPSTRDSCRDPPWGTPYLGVGTHKPPSHPHKY